MKKSKTPLDEAIATLKFACDRVVRAMLTNPKEKHVRMFRARMMVGAFEALQSQAVGPGVPPCPQCLCFDKAWEYKPSAQQAEHARYCCSRCGMNYGVPETAGDSAPLEVPRCTD